MVDPHDVRTIVVGAGVSGLACARALAGDVLVLERSERPGGLVFTAEVPEHGIRFEHGPEALAAGSDQVLELARAAGVEVVTSPGDAMRRYLVHRGELVAAPLSPPALLRSPLLSAFGKLRLLTEPWRSKSLGLNGSVADFVRHRLGPEALAALADPMVAGVHAGDPERLSVRACFPQLVRMVEESGSVFRAMRKRRGLHRVGLWKPAGGMQRLTDAWAADLGDALRLGVEVEAATVEGAGWHLRTSAGDFRCERLVVAVPLDAAVRLLRTAAPDVAPILGEMKCESLASVVHAYRREDVAHPLDGFGYLAASRESCRHLGTLFSSSIDPACAPAGVVVLRTLIGGARDPSAMDGSDPQLLDRCAEVRSLLGVSGSPIFAEVARYARALPRLDLGHPARLERLERVMPDRLTLLGNYTAGVGLTSLVREAVAAAG